MEMRKEILIVLLIALITRFLWLDARIVDFDESIHGWIALKSVIENQNYVYDPAYHGPFQYFILSVIFRILGDNNFSLRLPAAAFSVMGVVAGFMLKRWIGNSAYIFTFFLLFSPSILYYSRYARNDIIVLSSFLVALFFYLRYRESKRIADACISALFLAVIFTSKENWIQYLSFLVLIPVYGIYSEGRDYFRNINLPALAASATVFALFSAFMYSSAFVDNNAMEALLNAQWIENYLSSSISYWLKNAIGGSVHYHPVWYYALILLRYDFLALGIAILGAFYVKRELNFVEALAVFWTAVSVIFYHAMSYKTPWLVVHIVAPLAFFGSVFAGKEIFDEDKEALRFAFCILGLFTLIFAVHITYVNYQDTREPLIYIQTQPGAVEIAKRIESLAESGNRVLVYVPGHYYWPLPWMLRHVTVAYSGDRCTEGFDYVFTSERGECIKAGYKPVREYEMRAGVYIWEMSR
ncbi:flippase activity-associated protein Agl23 [Archaeoglobus neptunius]|uniref:flippase activity-associated protein Agl23 n=1 Tax=Archaeoglobus neptunius TaxID=2798580 RepID=UPI001927FA9B|nr:flippase activity-associated protein Agl23 [Archaeoglobus neptunius]